MKTLNLKYFGVTILIVRGYMMSSVTWPLDSAPLWKFKVPKILGHDLGLLGSHDVIDYVTVGLGVGTFLLVVNDDHASILRTRGFKDFGVTSLIFWDHVTSSVTWSLDSAYVVSYWFRICAGSNFAILPLLSQSPLAQGCATARLWLLNILFVIIIYKNVTINSQIKRQSLF